MHKKDTPLATKLTLVLLLKAKLVSNCRYKQKHRKNWSEGADSRR